MVLYSHQRADEVVKVLELVVRETPQDELMMIVRWLRGLRCLQLLLRLPLRSLRLCCNRLRLRNGLCLLLLGLQLRLLLHRLLLRQLLCL